MINSTIGTNGRLANHFFRNFAAHFISKNNNIKFSYSYKTEFFNLGIYFFQEGDKTYEKDIIISDENFFEYIKGNIEFNKNIIFDSNMYGQTKEFALYIKDYIYKDEQKKNIIDKNLFRDRYNNNNDVFIHIRLGDSVHKNPGFIYYDKVLSQIKFEKGYISSDLLTHPMCIALIRKYNLIEFNNTEVKTIMFASTCKNIILSNGTFSWLIGLLGFYSDVYYPKIKTIWHGDIFVFPEWKEIDTSNSFPPLPYEKALILMKKYGIKDFTK
jgi:hypothetical protein